MCLMTVGALTVGLDVHAATTSTAAVPGYQKSADEFAAALVVNAKTSERIYADSPDRAWPAASLTKLMSAIITVERGPNWQRVVALSSKDEVGGGRLRVTAGAKMTMQDLFYSAIVASANNTAMAMARVSGLGTNGFVKQMNRKAAQLGMAHTTFVDPVGIDPKNVTTASDVVKLANAAFRFAPIRRAASTQRYTFNIRNSRVVKTLTNTNKLLMEDNGLWVTGGKTGFLLESRYNLIVRMRPEDPDPKKPELLIVVLGAPTSAGSFESAEALAKWAWNP